MFDQNHLRLTMLNHRIAKQQSMLDEISTQLRSLTTRLDEEQSQRKRADDSHLEQGKELEQMSAQLLSLSERVDEGASQHRSTNMTFGVATACLMQHREGLEQVGAVVRDLMDRVAVMELQQRQAARAARVQGTPAKPTIKLERAAGTRRQERKNPFSRTGARSKV